MFVGTFEHNLDGKNRVFVPVKFREELGDNFIYKIFPSTHPSIQLFSKEAFEQNALLSVQGITHPIKMRNALAKCYLGTGTASYDSQGRIVINPKVAEKAGIEKQCIFVGFGTYVEVMSPETYDNYLQSICEDNVADEEAFDKEAEINRSYIAEGKFITLPNTLG